MTEIFSYSSFISYSSEDLKFSCALQSALEKFKIPKAYSKNILTKHRRLLPVFRDRSDLNHSKTLSAGINKALENSAWLIVICSKNSCKSEWVKSEIETFISLGRREKIIPVIISGDLDFYDKDVNENGTVPAIMNSHLKFEKTSSIDQLISDFRSKKINPIDKSEIEIQRIISTVLDVPLVDFTGRVEQQIQRKRLIDGFIILAFGAAVLIASFHYHKSYEAQNNLIVNSMNKKASEFIPFELVGDPSEAIKHAESAWQVKENLESLDIIKKALNFLPSYDKIILNNKMNSEVRSEFWASPDINSVVYKSEKYQYTHILFNENVSESFVISEDDEITLSKNKTALFYTEYTLNEDVSNKISVYDIRKKIVLNSPELKIDLPDSFECSEKIFPCYSTIYNELFLFSSENVPAIKLATIEHDSEFTVNVSSVGDVVSLKSKNLIIFYNVKDFVASRLLSIPIDENHDYEIFLTKNSYRAFLVRGDLKADGLQGASEFMTIDLGKLRTSGWLNFSDDANSYVEAGLLKVKDKASFNSRRRVSFSPQGNYAVSYMRRSNFYTPKLFSINWNGESKIDYHLSTLEFQMVNEIYDGIKLDKISADKNDMARMPDIEYINPEFSENENYLLIGLKSSPRLEKIIKASTLLDQQSWILSVELKPNPATVEMAVLNANPSNFSKSPYFETIPVNGKSIDGLIYSNSSDMFLSWGEDTVQRYLTRPNPVSIKYYSEPNNGKYSKRLSDDVLDMIENNDISAIKQRLMRPSFSN
jgi:hypothetical protein